MLKKLPRLRAYELLGDRPLSRVRKAILTAVSKPLHAQARRALKAEGGRRKEKGERRKRVANRYRARPDRWPGSSRGTQDTFGRAVRDLKGFVRERSGEL